TMPSARSRTAPPVDCSAAGSLLPDSPAAHSPTAALLDATPAPLPRQLRFVARSALRQRPSSPARSRPAPATPSTEIAQLGCTLPDESIPSTAARQLRLVARLFDVCFDPGGWPACALHCSFGFCCSSLLSTRLFPLCIPLDNLF